MGRKLALIIGNSVFEDSNLSQLNAPLEDVNSLVDILNDRDIGGFNQVQSLVNQGFAVVSKEIARFFNRKKSDDLLFLYFSGHGIRDKHGKLYLAVRDTERTLLSGTAIAAAFITDVMDGSLSKRQVLILDCCFSGAFGAKGIIGESVDTKTAFQGSGSGKVVLTATDSTQYAWEGDRVIGEAKSVFTHFLVHGLQTGAADDNDDGIITLDELYKYVYGQVIDTTSDQTPERWSYGQHGDIEIARSKRLPLELQKRLAAPDLYVRMGTLIELQSLLMGEDAQLSELAEAALQRMTQDDSRKLSAGAQKILSEHHSSQAETQVEEPTWDWKTILNQPWFKVVLIGLFAVSVLLMGVFVIPGLINSQKTVTETTLPLATETTSLPAVLPAASLTPTTIQEATDFSESTPEITSVPTLSKPTPTSLSRPATDEPFDEPLATWIIDDRGVDMLLVPAGAFEMGSEWGDDDESPVHTVWLDNFYLDKYEVTIAQYKECAHAGACDPPHDTSSATRGNYYEDPQFADYPVIHVTWHDAAKYCVWRNARLPTEAEWEKAARGTDGRDYPWGDIFDGNWLNYCDINCLSDTADQEYDDGNADTAPVGSYPNGASPYGMLDMAGNVWEWVADWYNSEYYADSAAENPQGPATGTQRVLRGGSWNKDRFGVRTTYRSKFHPNGSKETFGFRCAFSP
jgi:formylglycine-generating enzyme required for sulfatase activity